jgi:nicotinate-nucleotide--dimethylbenzimidazole phosphoribosyltransferase
MISTEVKATLDSIQPMLDPRVAGELTRQLDALAKATSSHGRLDDLVLHFGIVQGSAAPVLERKALYLFCGDHAVVEEGVAHTSPLSSLRRVQIILNGADPVSVLCRRFHIEPVVIDCGLAGATPPGLAKLHQSPAAANITRMPALTVDETNEALLAGIKMAVDAAVRFDAAGLAHIGDGASTSAAALFTALSGHEATRTCPHAEDQPESAHHRMVAAVRTAAGRHSADCVHPFGALRCLGGWDIAAMTGFILGAARKRLPVVIDGFLPAVAAMVARALAPDSLDAAIFAHESAHPAHALLHDFLGVEAYLSLHLHPDSGCAAPLLLDLIETSLKLVSETAPAGEPSRQAPSEQQ